ncbi:hypothetical protein ACTD5D_40370 [Nocardia takedensis]|uniref:hypothetical protein n=1 Tax=Nocardia takedensis TaxID=259390 RepID=UPI003F7589AC
MTRSYYEAIAEIAATMIHEINDDIAAGIVPETVRTWSELHSYLDANHYAEALVAALAEHRYWADVMNDAIDHVDTWLRAGRPDDIEQHTASSRHESTPIYLGEREPALPPVTRTDRRAARVGFLTEPSVYAPYTWREGLPPE